MFKFLNAFELGWVKDLNSRLLIQFNLFSESAL